MFKIPQELKDLFTSPATFAMLLGGAGYLAPIAITAFLYGSHMPQADWDRFVVEAKLAWQHASAAFGIILPFLLTFIKAARELFLAPSGQKLVPADAPVVVAIESKPVS